MAKTELSFAHLTHVAAHLRGKTLDQMSRDMIDELICRRLRGRADRTTWSSRLRQEDVPTWVLQELGGWKSEAMVGRYAQMSVKHLAPYADQLTFPDTEPQSAKCLETLEAVGTKVDTVRAKPRLTLVVSN